MQNDYYTHVMTRNESIFQDKYKAASGTDGDKKRHAFTMHVGEQQRGGKRLFPPPWEQHGVGREG